MNHDFDFIHGEWTVQHQRLKRRLAGSDEWEHFGGSARAWPLLGGQGNVDDNVIELPSGSYRAASLRAWDPETRQWAIWWLDGRSPSGIEVPVRGGFDAGVGSFFADENFEGRPIRVRFLWTDVDTANPQWEQAFSADAGRSWEVNWKMRFSRPR
jgi:hypothetical protein